VPVAATLALHRKPCQTGPIRLAKFKSAKQAMKWWHHQTNVFRTMQRVIKSAMANGAPARAAMYAPLVQQN
jgi:hypothetical protein